MSKNFENSNRSSCQRAGGCLSMPLTNRPILCGSVRFKGRGQSLLLSAIMTQKTVKNQIANKNDSRFVVRLSS